MKVSIIFGTLILVSFYNACFAQDERYFRVITEEGKVIDTLTRDGFITWSNAVIGGNYTIEVTDTLRNINWRPLTRGAVTSQVSRIRVFDPNTPAQMSYIPAGWFTMGTDDPDILTVGNVEHIVHVSPFYIGEMEVSAEDAMAVFQWALNEGLALASGIWISNLVGDPQPLLRINNVASLHSYADGQLSLRTGRDRHPCTALTWYGAVAYCNFLSQKNGLPTCYDLSDWSCDFSKTGFRLPTESEWEKAARGGYEGRLFPWGNTITHDHANYRGRHDLLYDESEVEGFHPVYDTFRPIRTAPIGSFQPNGYGLYDVCGNVFEWLWDLPGKYTGATLFDPRGPEIIIGEALFKGGTWLTAADRVLLASRYTAAERVFTHSDIGMRLAMSVAE